MRTLTRRPSLESGLSDGRRRNDPRQYDAHAADWWRRGGPFAVLRWLAAARAAMAPTPRREGAVLVDVGCGGGLLAPFLPPGYLHIGVDLRAASLTVAAGHGVLPAQGDAGALPLASGCADVVVAGEIFEHVNDLAAAVGECCRLLRPGGLLIVDTLNDTWLSRTLTVTIGERLPRVPRGLHDPSRYVSPRLLTALCARHGVDLQVTGARPTLWPTLRWLASGADTGRIVPSRWTTVLYQAVGVRSGGQA
ncbi:methyltransferase domain-containing protein [Pilimelia columellifera]|uniref:Methyltransferase type 11 domain-containing protein n=1 Tax=Pilimelia columellifera subsp. columellifera TaxID=706583 RepID=A0ABN3ND23_9ACTN